jgi:hypothetical protein
MAIWDIFRGRSAVAERAEGRITHLRTEMVGGAERWVFGLDSRPGEEFVFAPTPLSPVRRRGDRIAVAFHRAGDDRPHAVEQITPE